jgi:hypothetical protein
MADDEHRPEQLGLAQNGLRLRNHVRGRELIPSMPARLAAALALFTAITNAWKNVKPMRATADH